MYSKGFVFLTQTIDQQMSSVIPHSLFTEYDIFLFKQGKHYKLFNLLGSHALDLDGVKGVYFAVWAPSARKVSVVGNFNYWNGESHPLFPKPDGSGLWEGFIPGVGLGEIYKYHILAADGRHLMKADPYAKFCETPSKTASITWGLDYEWKDGEWLKTRKTKANDPKPFAVYEMHLGSWKKHPDGSPMGYRELAHDMVPYVKEMGFTHVEFMPIMEHPYLPSWGYQLTGYFAPTSRYGTPQDFMYLVDAFHQAGIGVLLDWVPSHFPTDAHGLADFDGTHLYNHADPKQGFHPDWKTFIFNLSRNEVRSFLISNAIFWLEKYHIDGFRVDAVASMLYLDYSREDGQWVPNEYGGNENFESIDFLREFNSVVYREYPDVVTIAEESTAWDGVSRPVHFGGLGFGQKWMMGWMHDTLKFLEHDPIHRKFHHNEITFSIYYAFTENFMLPLSHDEVVHGKASLIYKMAGDEWQKFAHLRLLYGYMYTHPGTKLLFMGGEFAQTREWDFKTSLDWQLLQFDSHRGIQEWVRQLNGFYTSSSALYELQFDKEGFQWVDYSDHQNSVISYLRKGADKYNQLLVVCNFTPVVREDYELRLPMEATWREVLNSDAEEFGGSGYHLNGTIDTIKRRELNVVSLKLAPLSIIVFEPEFIIEPPKEEE